MWVAEPSSFSQVFLILLIILKLQEITSLFSAIDESIALKKTVKKLGRLSSVGVLPKNMLFDCKLVKYFHFACKKSRKFIIAPAKFYYCSF